VTLAARLGYGRRVASEKYASKIALSKTQKLLAIPSGESPRVCIRVPVDELPRWREAMKKSHARTLTAVILRAMGEHLDRLGIK
jgi:hypothetical protein